MIICGIKTGAKGTIALLDDGFAEIHDMPMLRKGLTREEVATLFSSIDFKMGARTY